jgi:histidinol dehydrogenase
MTTSTTTTLRFGGSVESLSDDDRRALYDRSTSSEPEIRSRVEAIIADVRARGDAALRTLARDLDGVDLDALEVPRERCRAALDRAPRELRTAMERAARNITAAATSDLPDWTESETEPGILIGRRPRPLGRVGVYAPGGRAAYPSSVLMGAVPARVAGVGEVVLCSPPQRNGLPSDAVLAAAALADVDRVFAVGGAGAIAAMAYGTTSIPRVDRIVGPGNAYVAEAKLQVTGAVAIDAPAGPSELLVVADDSCDVNRIALELIAQAEHDPRACSVAIVVGARTADGIRLALEDQLARADRADITREALAANGGVIATASIDAAIAFANAYAPEHLLIVTRDDDAVLDRVRTAGTVFLGQSASVAFGDYCTGANHVLPTGGLARCYSGLSVLDFIRWTTYQRVSPLAAASLALDVAVFAEAEGLPGHAAAARAAGGLA